MLSVKFQLAQPVFVRPRRPVKAFNGSPYGHVRPVANFNCRNSVTPRALRYQLTEGLGGVKGARRIAAGEDNLSVSLRVDI